MSNLRYDCVVFGAGTAGAAAAWHLARGGARVALVDHRREAACGARWVNGVPPWMFAEAGVAPPTPPELRPVGGVFSVAGVAGLERVRVDPNPVWQVDMRRLVARLQGLAAAAGAQRWLPARLVELCLGGAGRPTAAVVTDGDGRHTLSARLFVDATGMAGALRRRVPALAASCPLIGAGHVCSAAQAVHGVADPAAARAAFASFGLQPGDLRSVVGLDGGFSTANLALSPEGDHVELLAGTIADPRLRSGGEVLRGLVEAHPWIGARIFGGAGAIPLRRPFDRLGAPGVALLGNAACQVVAAHGSGVGVGLVAARILAEAALGASDPGSEAAVWDYQQRFQRGWGGRLAAFDLFRRATQRLSGEETDGLMAAGVVTASSTRATLEQRVSLPDLAELPRILRGLWRTPRLSAGFLGALGRIPRAQRLYARHPRGPDPAALARWSAQVAALFDEPPDLPDV